MDNGDYFRLAGPDGSRPASETVDFQRLAEAGEFQAAPTGSPGRFSAGELSYWLIPALATTALLFVYRLALADLYLAVLD